MQGLMKPVAKASTNMEMTKGATALPVAMTACQGNRASQPLHWVDSTLKLEDDSHGQGGDDEQNVSNDTDGGSNADRLEATPLSVGDDATEDGQDVCRKRGSARPFMRSIRRIESGLTGKEGLE